MAHDASYECQASGSSGTQRAPPPACNVWWQVVQGMLQRMFFTVNLSYNQLHMAKYFLIFLDVGRQDIGKTNKFDSKPLHLT